MADEVKDDRATLRRIRNRIKAVGDELFKRMGYTEAHAALSMAMSAVENLEALETMLESGLEIRIASKASELPIDESTTVASVIRNLREFLGDEADDDESLLAAEKHRANILKQQN